MATYKAVVLQGGRHVKEDGTTNIKIRIYHNRSAQYIPTGHYILPEYLSESGEVLPSHPSAEILNYDITNQIQKYREISIKLGTERLRFMTALDLKQEILRNIELSSDVIDFVAFSRILISKTQKPKTADWYLSSLKSLIKFFGKDVIDAREMTTHKIEEYMMYLSNTPIGEKKSTKYLEPGTINNYMRALRAIYNKTKKYYNNEDFDIIRIPNNPFERVNIPKYRRKRKNISVEILTKIISYNFSTERTNMARDVFMMLFYLMGINIGDFFRLKGEIRGRIEYERSKTNTIEDNEHFPLSIKIEPELRLLINKYSQDSFLSYFHNRYSCEYNFMKAVNTGLKAISKELELNIPLSTNWARHTWASIARNRAGVNKADIDFCLGHVNNDYKMADIYIETDYTICDESNRKVLDLLKKNK